MITARAIILTSVTAILMCSSIVTAQTLDQGSQARTPFDEALLLSPETREGTYEVTLNTPDRKVIPMDKLVRDRDINPESLYRIYVGGYLGFDEKEWIRSIAFRPEDIRITELREYRPFARIVQDLNARIEAINQRLAMYDQMALRLTNICGQSKFGRDPNHIEGMQQRERLESLNQEIDREINEHLVINTKLQRLKDLIVHTMTSFTTDRSCRSRFEEYSKRLERYKTDLEKLTKDYEELMDRGRDFNQTLSAAETTGLQSR